ncbi:MAG TPA: hypothetical protein VH000_03625 [Rhizomicrobium sp.]|nr:hypothetical protein [Rhizomicrobium sp.]
MLAEAATAATTVRSQVLAALHQASGATGADFDYLLSTATRESGLKPQAKASTSSASGLFQFVGQTWLGLVKNYGAKYGLGSYADQISKTAHGGYHADNAADHRAILALRNDPQISALMAGEYANATKNQLQGSLGRSVNNGELYCAHFLGEGAACKLIRMNGSNPSASAAGEFPDAAAANRSVFYHANGTPKTVREVYNWSQRQPGVCQPDDSATSAAPADAPDSFNMQTADTTDYSQVDARLAAMPSYSPICTTQSARVNGSTKPLISTASLPQAPFALTSSIVNMLSTMVPSLTPHKASDNDRANAQQSVTLSLMS